MPCLEEGRFLTELNKARPCAPRHALAHSEPLGVTAVRAQQGERLGVGHHEEKCAAALHGASVPSAPASVLSLTRRAWL